MLHLFHCCYFCGKPLFKESFVCASCLIVPTMQSRCENGLQHQYLYNYNSYSEIFVKKLKYGKFSSVIDQIDHRFLPDLATVIALPNSKNLRGEKNHSYVLAKKLFPHSIILEPFEKISDKQAIRKKGERRKVRMQLIHKVDTDKLVIFVDDLLTTGSTVRRAWELLGEPKAKIITLGYTSIHKKKKGG